MQGAARNFFTLAIVFAIVGVALGLHMAMSQVHTQVVTHAHIMLAGWVTSALFAFFYHLFPAIGARPIAMIHFWIQAIAAVVMLGSLFMLYGGNPAFDPGAAIGALTWGFGMLLFAFIALPAIWKA